MLYISQIAKDRETSGRSEVIDFAKGLAIILMVIGHATLEGGPFARWLHGFIYTFHMPFFLIISGFLYNENKGKNASTYVKRKFNSLWLKFVLYNCIFIILNNFFWKIHLINADYPYFNTFWYEYSFLDIVKKLFRTFFTLCGPEEMALALWYLKDLFVVSIAFMLLNKITAFNRSRYLIPIIALLIGVLCPRIGIPLIGADVKRLFCELILYSMGFYLKDSQLKLNLPVTMVLLILSVISPFIFEFVELRWIDGILPTLRFLLFGILGFLWYIWFTRNIYQKGNALFRKIVVTVNSYAVPIIALHVFSFKLATYVVRGGVSSYNITPQTDSDILWIVYSIVGIVLPIILVNIVRFVNNRFLKIWIKKK